MLNIEKFREELKFASPVDYLDYLLDAYTDSSEVNFNSNDGRDLRELYRKDITSAGLVNAKDKETLLSKRLVIDYMKHLGVYETYTKAEKADKDQLYLSVSKELKEKILKFSGYIVLNSADLFGTPSQGAIDHEFSLNVNADDLYKVVMSLYTTARSNDINFFITVPNRSKEAKGINDGVNIICSTENLEATVKLFDLLPEDIKALCKAPCPLGARIEGWLGYTSMDNDLGEEMSAIVGLHFISAIDKALYSLSQEMPELIDYVEVIANPEEKGKDKARIAALQILRENNNEVYNGLVNVIANELTSAGINLETMFLSKTASAEIDEMFGKEVVEEVVVEEPAPEETKEQVFEVPAPEVVEETPVVDETPVVEETPVTSEYRPVELGENNIISVAALVGDAEPVIEEVPEGDFLDEAERAFLVEEAEMIKDADLHVQLEEEIIDPANRVKYTELGISDEKLDTLVINEKGQTVTLYHYLESNDTLAKIPVNSQVILATDVGSKDSGSVISGADFITGTVVEYATKLGEISVDDIIARYATEIKEEELKKKGFFGGLFGKK